jgi:hypothetical protein
MIQKPKRKTKEMILCAECNKPIHIDDLGVVSYKGLYHKDCCFKIYQLHQGFLIGVEMKVKSGGEK